MRQRVRAALEGDNVMVIAQTSSRAATTRRGVVALLVAGVVWPQASAQNEIVVAQVGPFSGPLAVNGIANFVGAQAYFQAVNARGGIGGRMIRFVKEDDAYKPEETVRLLKLVAERDKPVAFVNLLGSANASAMLNGKVLDQLGIPVVGLTPGSEALRKPGSPHLFHLQAGDAAQLGAIARHLGTIGLARAAVVYQDNPFGKTGLASIEAFAAETGLKIVAKASMAIGSEDAKAAAAAVRASTAQACVMILAPNSGAAFVRDLRDQGAALPIYGLSYVTADLLVQKAGAEKAAGVALAQVTPNPTSATSGLTREFHGVMQQFAPKDTQYSSMNLLGYLAARVTVEAIRRAGSSNPAAVEKALRELKLDLGGYAIDFTDGSQVGSRKVDIGVIDRGGNLRY